MITQSREKDAMIIASLLLIELLLYISIFYQGTVSEEYPSQEMLDRLDPKPLKSLVSFKKRTSPSTSPEPMTSIPDAKKQKLQESDSE